MQPSGQRLTPTRRRSLLTPSFLLLLSACCFALLIQPISSILYPLQHEILARHTQCIYSRFAQGDFATFELFIVSADESGRPEAAVMIEGPVASPKVGDIDENGERTWGEKPAANEGRRKSNTMGALMQDSIDNWPAFVRDSHKLFTEAGIVHHSFHIDYTHSGGHEDAIAARADISRQRNEDLERRRQRKLERREKERVEEEVYQEERGRIEKIIPERIKPYEWTKPIKAAGWYRMCAQAENSIMVEMDIRSSAELGGLDPETWHVYTHEEREAIDEEERIMVSENKMTEGGDAKLVAEELDRALQGQVQDYDLGATRKLLSEVNRIVLEIQKQQQNIHRRFKGNESAAWRNSRRIVRSSAIKTAFYIAITIFQMNTVRKWLLSNHVLGRT